MDKNELRIDRPYRISSIDVDDFFAVDSLQEAGLSIEETLPAYSFAFTPMFKAETQSVMISLDVNLSVVSRGEREIGDFVEMDDPISLARIKVSITCRDVDLLQADEGHEEAKLPAETLIGMSDVLVGATRGIMADRLADKEIPVGPFQHINIRAYIEASLDRDEE